MIKDLQARIYKLEAWWFKWGAAGVRRLGGRFPSTGSRQAPRQARDRLFDSGLHEREPSLRMTGGTGQRLSVWKRLKVFKRSHHANRARHKAALLCIRLSQAYRVDRWLDVSAVTCLRGFSRPRVANAESSVIAAAGAITDSKNHS